jgi:hypothetical protein
MIFEPNRISYASVFPFLNFAREFRERYDVEIRCLPVNEALRQGVPDRLMATTHVVAQSWLTDPRARHEELNRLITGMPRVVRKAYLDSFANCDIRLAGIFDSVDLYYKKSLFNDSLMFTRATYGHTNLTEYYGHLYALDDQMTDWGIQPSMLEKLRLAPNFLTDPELSYALQLGSAVAYAKKDIDLHARLGGTKAVGWYGEMRRHASRVVGELSGLRVVQGTGVSRRIFMDELRRSKACFSPFGYGEICWRDIEAFAAGAVLIKPDMSHLRTEPDLYRDGETYVACRWDFGDLAEKTNYVLSNGEKMASIAANARWTAKNYLEMSGPVNTYKDLFEG